MYWGNTLGITLFCIQWGLIALGTVIICVFGPGRFSWLHFTLYFTIGWSGLILVPDWIKHNVPLLCTILLGGVIYTVGMIPFTKDKDYDHFIWHFFVLAGAIIHWFGIYYFLY